MCSTYPFTQETFHSTFLSQIFPSFYFVEQNWKKFLTIALVYSLLFIHYKWLLHSSAHHELTHGTFVNMSFAKIAPNCSKTESQVGRGVCVWRQARHGQIRCSRSSRGLHASRVGTLHGVYHRGDAAVLWKGLQHAV
jgi:hypothetical protein